MQTKNTDPFIVSDETCKGCLYYGKITGLGSCTRCCDYTYLTGKLKPKGETCAECSVKVVRRRRRNTYSLTGGKDKKPRK